MPFAISKDVRAKTPSIENTVIFIRFCFFPIENTNTFHDQNHNNKQEISGERCCVNAENGDYCYFILSSINYEIPPESPNKSLYSMVSNQ